MLKSVEKLVKGDAKKVGNHCTVKHDNGIQEFFYYATAICTVNHSLKTFTTDNGGWGTSSTSRAINDYIREFTSRGYALID